VLFIDLDGFKMINDSYGHNVGDQLLITVAQRLVDTVRPGDTVARLGGDEFIVLCDQVKNDDIISQVAERIMHALHLPIELEDRNLFVTASIGIAQGNGETHTAGDLMRNSDAAMYLAKEYGRNRWQMFNFEIHEKVKRHLGIANGLRTAIENGELHARYQPIMDLASRKIVGAEMLTRWFPADEEVFPDVFIPIAEKTGSIVPIGEWVFEQACHAEMDLRTRFGMAHAPYISVNVSTRQLNDHNLVSSFTDILARSKAEPKRILLEVTETSLMEDIKANLEVLHKLSNLGLRVAIDDFGTGYSSLSLLTQMPLSNLKIDKVFVDELGGNSGSPTIVAAVIGMGRALGFDIIAEGIEDEQQLMLLKALGCEKGQGYLFHKPMKLSNLEQLIIDQTENTDTIAAKSH